MNCDLQIAEINQKLQNLTQTLFELHFYVRNGFMPGHVQKVAPASFDSNQTIHFTIRLDFTEILTVFLG